MLARSDQAVEQAARRGRRLGKLGVVEPDKVAIPETEWLKVWSRQSGLGELVAKGRARFGGPRYR